MKIVSRAFKQGQAIPTRHTGDGEDISPALIIQDPPEGTQTFALIMDDPDAPSGTFDHWIIWNLAPDKLEIPEGFASPFQGINHFQELRYRGPMPPPGKPHRYFFKLYALDTSLQLAAGITKAAILRAMEGHILEQAEIMGTYQRF